MNRTRSPRRGTPLIIAVAIGALAAPAPAGEQFESSGVELKSHIPLSGFASQPTGGNDCWGYVSPSGREYALMGVRNAMAIVEITDPSNPVIVAEIPHPDCLWGDMKVYGDRAYVVTDCASGGMDIVDLSDIDNGNAPYVVVAPGGLTHSHNVEIDTASGYLYLSGSNLNGGRITVLSLANPDNPVIVGQAAGAVGTYSHDAEVVTYTSGPYAGKQICFSANGGTGLDIYDVTNKAGITRLSRTLYPNLAYAHQIWLDADQHYLYLNDELDLVNETVIFDVSDLSAPFVAGTSSSNLDARDHNGYVHDGFLFESDYRSGLRIFCAEDPVNPAEVGWFDTYPGSDSGAFNGAWSNYPFFPSGTVIVSDEDRGLFVLDPSAALVAGSIGFTYPDGRPDTVNPNGGTTVRVETAGICSGVTSPGTGVLYYDDGNGFQSVPMTVVADDVYDAVFPAVECGRDVAWYVSAETAGGTTIMNPSGAPANTYTATAMTGTSVVLNDDFETDMGWTATNGGATSGDWERGVPINDPSYIYDPASDSDGSGQCWLSDNSPGQSDIDGGLVYLDSPPLDMTAPNLAISYDYFCRLTNPNGNDGIRVMITSDANPGSYIELTRHTADGGLSWHHQSFTPDQIAATGVTLTAATQVRFIGSDGLPDSIVEVGIDAFQVTELTCDTTPGDLDGDGLVGINDFLTLLSLWGPCGDCGNCPADLDGDCTVGINDFLMLLANWT